MIWGISAKMNVAEITVLGVGNILLGDEGAGVRAVEQLQLQGELSDSVQLLDGGTLGMELLRFLKGTKRLLLLDAVQGVCIGGSATCKARLVRTLEAASSEAVCSLAGSALFSLRSGMSRNCSMIRILEQIYQIS